MKNLKAIAVIAIVAIMLLVVALPTNAAFDGVTITVTSNVGNTTEVNPGDEIIYTIKVKNASANDYIVPTILAYAPEQTEIVDIEIDKSSENDTKEVNKEYASYVGFTLPANSEVNFKLTIKISDNATGNIKFANVTENDEDAYGAVLAFLATVDVTGEELSNFVNAMDNLENYNSVEEVQTAIGDNIYFDIITQPQTNPIKVQETTEEPVEEPKTEEVTEEEPKTEEVVEETKTEEKKEETTKPSKLPKTGAEYSVFAIISALVMLAVGIKLTK